LKCKVIVYRLINNIRCAFVAVAFFKEYYPNNPKNTTMWNRMPHVMIEKCAEAKALRKAFPQELSGIYESSEMHQVDDNYEKEHKNGNGKPQDNQHQSKTTNQHEDWNETRIKWNKIHGSEESKPLIQEVNNQKQEPVKEQSTPPAKRPRPNLKGLTQTNLEKLEINDLIDLIYDVYEEYFGITDELTIDSTFLEYKSKNRKEADAILEKNDYIEILHRLKVKAIKENGYYFIIVKNRYTNYTF
jgi:hypothetical protein